MSKQVHSLVSGNVRRAAAAYVRMSTEKQNYSIQHQLVVIDDYALRHELSIVQTYVDSGKSGLKIEGRHGLQHLLLDVLSGQANYSTILVYDVSRWGRFQDADESAYYEFVCRRAGIDVIYCAEIFAEDVSPMAAILKSLKRLMAGEYSRELSTKVFAAQSNFVMMGFRQGGLAGYGLRRVVLDQSGQQKYMLEAGQRKHFPTDRVVLTTGPDEEIVVVNTIYDWYLRLKLGDKRIATMLNIAGIASESGGPWTKNMVRSILTNEKYIGNAVYNRSSYKLRKHAVENPQSIWVRKNGAFSAVVAADRFTEAQAERTERHRWHTDEELLGMLRDIHAQHGRISALLINQHPTAPTDQTFKYHFGTLANAYSLAGIARSEHFNYVESRRALREVRANLIKAVIDLVVRAEGTATPVDGQGRLLINGNLVVKVMTVRCQQEGPRCLRRWRLKMSMTQGADFTIAAQMSPTNRSILYYYLLPMAEVTPSTRWLPLPPRVDFPSALHKHRFSNLGELFGLHHVSTDAH